MKTPEQVKAQIELVSRSKTDQYHPMEFALFDKAYCEALRWVLE